MILLAYFAPFLMFGRNFRAPLPLLGLAVVVCLPNSAWAIRQPDHLRGRAELELASPTAAPVRTERAGIWTPPRVGARGRAFARLQAELGPSVQARFDADTGVLDTLIPAGFAVVGASRSPAIAEQFALDFLSRHIDLLAPGSSAADFQVVSDVTSDGLRSVGLVQRHAGLLVIGGQLSLHFKNDRLIAARSQALPNIQLPRSSSSIMDASTIEARAIAWLAHDFAAGRSDGVRLASAIEGPEILPLVHTGGSVEFREVVSVELELLASPGHWLVYLDARTGEPVARRSLLRWAELEYTAWRRSPLGPRAGFPGAFVDATIDNAPTITNADGTLSLPASGATVGFGTDGVYLRVYNDNGPVSSVATPLAPSQLYTWDLGNNPEQDAQLNAYVHAQVVKNYVRALDPEFPALDLETRVTVNIADVCNAYANGNTLNFFLTGGGCENSALIADIIYHEYGHVAHTHGLIPGVGLFDGAHSEGASDYLAATIVDDSATGKGFFLDSEEPIRELDPIDFEWRWPEHAGEVHDEGRIIGGTLWDLRKVLIQKYGVAEGVARTDRIWMDGIRRAVDIPSTYLEALITNDDDGNLQNGTPDICEINEVFAAHGLYEPPGSTTEVSTQTLADGSTEVTLSFGQPFAGCPDFAEPTGVVRHRPRSDDGAPVTAVELSMTPVGTGSLRAVIPPQPQQSVTQFQVELDWGNGTIAARPQNFGDPWYEYFTGEVTEIWCADFNENPDTYNLSFDGEWDWGVPGGGSGDPNAAYDGGAVMGINLEWPGLYSPNTSSTLTLPSIDVSGFEVVRLQYQRWLNVEDGYWDRATISANGELAWGNYASPDELISDIHHRDREWRFHDVVLTPYVGASKQLQLDFGLVTDGGLELGGWTIDQLCVVGHNAIVPVVACGDGYLHELEQCDDGNLDNGDGCSSGCLLEEPIDETGEPPIDEVDEIDWDPDGRGCGCVSTDDDERGGGATLALLGLFKLFAGLGLRRRRRGAMLRDHE
jgi:MYXO-CTERM domain-containing protein